MTELELFSLLGLEFLFRGLGCLKHLSPYPPRFTSKLADVAFGSEANYQHLLASK